MSYEPTEYSGTVPPTRSVSNPYEMPDIYSQDKVPPLPPPTTKPHNVVLPAVILLLLFSVLTGIIGYSVGSTSTKPSPTVTPVDAGATATFAHDLGYTEGQSWQQGQDINISNATATASYNNGQSDELKSLYDFLYNGATSTGRPCESANITDTQGNRDYRYIRMYKDSSGNIQEECLSG